MITMKRRTLTSAIALAMFLTGFALIGDATAEPIGRGVNSTPENTPAATQQDVQPVDTRGPNYVDADGDGVCDNRPACGQGKGRRGGYVDANGDGICDNQGAGARGQRNGQGGARRGYVDADGNGVCDNQGLGDQHRRRGHGQGRGQGRGQGNR